MTIIEMLDTTFDVRTDSRGKDPDKFSPTLRRYHKLLWSKRLPGGDLFTLNDNVSGAYLHHRSGLGEFFLASDTVIHTFTTWKRMKHITQLQHDEDNQSFMKMAYSIGGMMIFPGNRIENKPTINGARGFNGKIADRMDLTLECIRRHYQGQTSPLADTLARYREFFALFHDFRGYIDFFLLQDLVSPDYSAVRYMIPFENFDASPLPKDLGAYREYRRIAIDFINSRNQRMAAHVLEAP